MGSNSNELKQKQTVSDRYSHLAINLSKILCNKVAV